MLELAREIRNEAAEADDFEVQGMFEGFIGGFMKQLWFLRAMRSKAADCSDESSCCCGK